MATKKNPLDELAGIIGCVVFLPVAVQSRIPGWNDKDANGDCIVDVELTVGGIRVPIKRYAESLYDQLGYLVERKAKELVKERLGSAYDKLDEIETVLQNLSKSNTLDSVSGSCFTDSCHRCSGGLMTISTGFVEDRAELALPLNFKKFSRSQTYLLGFHVRFSSDSFHLLHDQLVVETPKMNSVKEREPARAFRRS